MDLALEQDTRAITEDEPAALVPALEYPSYPSSPIYDYDSPVYTSPTRFYRAPSPESVRSPILPLWRRTLRKDWPSKVDRFITQPIVEESIWGARGAPCPSE